MRSRNPSKRNLPDVIIAYFLIHVVWGSTYFFIGVAPKDSSSSLLGALWFTTAGLILPGICYLRGEQIFKKSLVKRSVVSGIVLLFVDMAVAMLTQRYLTSSLVATIASSMVPWILFLDAPMQRTNFRNPPTIAGGGIGFGGVVMLYAEQLDAEWLYPQSERGILLLVFGCIFWALGTLYAKHRSSHEEEVNTFAGSARQVLFVSVMFWVCAIVNGDVREADLSTISVTSWFSLPYLISSGSLLAYSAYVWLLKVRPTVEVGTRAYVNPSTAVLLGVSFGNEQATFVQLSGLLVILLGVMLISRKRNKMKSTAIPC